MNSLGNAKVTVASWEPRILVVDDFMTEAEADHMVKTVGGSKRLGSTAVVTTTGGAAVLANTVTSKIGTFPHADPVVRPPPPAATATKPSELTPVPRADRPDQRPHLAALLHPEGLGRTPPRVAL